MVALAAVETPLIANVEEEAALLGAMMHERGLIDPIADRLQPEHFAEAVHGRIFEAIVKLHSEGKTASPVTLKPLFADDPDMKDLGGPSYLVTIMGNSGVAVIGARDFADDIRELAQKRILADRLRDIMAECHRGDSNSRSLVDSVEQALACTVERDRAAVHLTAADCVKRVMNGLDKHEHGVSCGIGPIDEGLGAILPKQLVIVAGRPSMGKSAVASSYALGAAGRGHGVLFVSLEMSDEELGERIVADMCFDSSCQVPYSASPTSA
jgi:replicative DNA helicase